MGAEMAEKRHEGGPQNQGTQNISPKITQINFPTRTQNKMSFSTLFDVNFPALFDVLAPKNGTRSNAGFDIAR